MADKESPKNVLNRASKTFVFEGTVRFSDVDSNRHVNNSVYSTYCEEATLHVFACGGVEALSSDKEPIAPVVRRAEYDYLGELRYGDAFRIESTIVFSKPTRGVLNHSVIRKSDGECVCRCVSHGFWMNLDTNRPHRLSEKEIAVFLDD